ncbi:DUF6474 family protein [Skermania piniformis]|uniref:Uncharacterized protein n=1 Tax=Skermania pinensis TaxID=39122 RepID=A0ABX8S926_9ACTN|nr:DUF6474 family protein [Skermania piniformis]QXQ13976.1 hypothetical protein KV203_00425 [Skermania piniformis]
MGLFSKRGRRARRKAEAKALARRAEAEAKISTKIERTRLRADLKSQKKRDEAQSKVDAARLAKVNAEKQVALKQAARAGRDPLSVSQVRKYLTIARMVTPVLAPIAYRAATFVRGQVEAKRAERLGVPVDELDQFTGSGARLSARISSAENSLAEIERRHPDDTETTDFATATRARLVNLTTAVQTAEPMPLARRRAAHQAISTELSGIEADLLARLGLH